LPASDDQRLPLPLDQNFPAPILAALDAYIVDVRFIPLRTIDPLLTDMSDRRLLLALDAMGFQGLVSNNYKMMQNPFEIAGLLATNLSLFVIEGLGHDPIRATGAVLLDLPGAIKKMTDRAEVFWMRPRNPEAQLPWDLFSKAAGRQHKAASELYEEVKVTADEKAAALPDQTAES
jgi:hypothetical protein